MDRALPLLQGLSLLAKRHPQTYSASSWGKHPKFPSYAQLSWGDQRRLAMLLRPALAVLMCLICWAPSFTAELTDTSAEGAENANFSA